MGVGGDDVDLGTSLLEFGVVLGRVFDLGRAIEGEAAGMKISTDHLPFRLSSDTVMNSPLPPRLTKAVVLNGWTGVLIRDMKDSFAVDGWWFLNQCMNHSDDLSIVEFGFSKLLIEILYGRDGRLPPDGAGQNCIRRIVCACGDIVGNPGDLAALAETLGPSTMSPAQIQHFINGQRTRVSSARTQDVFNPPPAPSPGR